MTAQINFLLGAMPVLLKGAGVTVVLSALGMVLSLALGLPLALCRISRHVWLRWPAGAYISFIRGTPILIQVLLVFLVLPALFGVQIPAFPAGVLGLGLNSSAFMAEIIRGGIQSVSRGQVEAARALGMSRSLAMRRIVLPQIWHVILPAISNELITVLKASTILSAITVTELTRTGQQIVATTFRPVETYAVVAMLYLAVNLLISYVTNRVHRRWLVTRQG